MTIVVVGESLVDVLEHADGRRDERCGGSPANVAVGLGRLGHDVALLTALGDDARGATLREHLVHSGVRLSASPIARTATAHATVAGNGDAHYTFDIAWDISDLVPPPRPDWLHVGSIGTALEPGAAHVRALAEKHAGTCPVSYDPNFRPTVTGPPDLDAIDGLVGLADVVKLSEQDATSLDSDPFELACRWSQSGPSVVVVTRGAAGCSAVVNGEVLHHPVPRAAAVVDTVGAGDAFMAGLIDALVPRRPWDRAAVSRALARASEVALRTCERVGADPPWRQELV